MSFVFKVVCDECGLELNLKVPKNGNAFLHVLSLRDVGGWKAANRKHYCWGCQSKGEKR